MVSAIQLLLIVNGASYVTFIRDRRGRDRMVVELTTTCAICAYHQYHCEFEPVHGEVYSIQHYVIKFISDLPQVSGFHRVLRFPLAIKLPATI